MSGDHPGSSQARDHRLRLLAALTLAAGLVAPVVVSALRDPSSIAPADSATSGPPASATLPGARPSSTLHLAATGAPGQARATLDGIDLGPVAFDPTDGGIRGEALIRIGAAGSFLSTVHLSITRDPGVPQALADGIQRMVAMDGALDTVVVEPR